MKKNLRKEIENLESDYINSTNYEELKSKGQFFTPKLISDWMSNWLTTIKPKNLLDPSLGFGALISNFINVVPKIKIYAIEKDKKIFKIISNFFDERIIIYNKDFLNIKLNKKFEAIIANPPYIRFHKRDLKEEIFVKYEKMTNLKISRLSNIYILFVIEIINLLEVNGRASVIIPNEWMNSNFGKSLKQHIKNKAISCKIIYISHESLVFNNNNLSTASILLLENKNNKKNNQIQFVYVKNYKKFFETNPNRISTKPDIAEHYIYNWKDIIEVKKWDSLFNKNKSKFTNSITMSKIALSKRGIATGSNSFFLREFSFIKKNNYKIENFDLCIGKAHQAKGVIFNKKELDQLKLDNSKVYLFNPKKLYENEKKLINEGEQLGINHLYLPSHRKTWYINENRKIANIWVPVFNRDRVKFIYNNTNCKNLTCFHCVYVNLPDNLISALVALLNLDIVQDSVLKQKRVYGGGLIKFEPKDILDIEIPDITKLSNSSIKKLNKELLHQDYCLKNKIDYKSNIKNIDLEFIDKGLF